MRWPILCVLAALAAFAQDNPAEYQRPGENIALDKPYTLHPNPSYALCRDPGDATQLTDGELTVGHFWTQMSTVGYGGQTWRAVIDLGQVEPIVGVSYRTAAGRAGVTWPESVRIFVSDDGDKWYEAGELVELSNRKQAPPEDIYTHWRYWTDELPTHGRYVAFSTKPGGPYSFADELEVYRGDAELLTRDRGKPAPSLEQAIQAINFREDLKVEADELREAINQSALAGERKAALLGELDEAAGRLGDGFDPAATGRRPLGEPERRLMAVRAKFWRAQQPRDLAVWSATPWDPVKPGTAPAPEATAAVEVAMMRNETRSAALNLTNGGGMDRAVTITVAGFPGAPSPDWLTVREVVYTAAKLMRVAGSALPAAENNALTLPAGMTKQVWLEIDSAGLPAGDHQGELLVKAGDETIATVPMGLHVADLTMPEELTLALGGWDYTNAMHRGVTEENRQKLVDFLQAYHVNAPWATSSVMRFGQHDETGKMTAEPDTAQLDEWLELWPDARWYCVFNAFNETVETPEQRQKVADWINFYAAYLKEKGVEPSQLVLLLVDETRSEEQDARIVSYAEVIHEQQPEVVIFNDPIWVEPQQAGREMLEASDMLCPNRVRWIEQREGYEQTYLPLQNDERLLAFYSCSGTARTLDPYSYYRLQAWEAFRYGAIYEAFWAFGDTGGGSSWTEYDTPGTVFAPQFLDDDSVVTSKEMEAIREGLYDYEYLVMLRDAVRAAEQAGRNDAPVQRAKALLAEAPAKVIGAEGAEQIQWADAKDRSLADQVRRDVLAALEALR